jgi:hypothetical protein
LNKQLLEAENKRKNAEAQYVAIKDSPDAINALSQAENQRFIQDRETAILAVRNDTAKKIADYRAQRAKLLQEYKESAPEIVEIDTQIRSLEDSLNKVVEDNNQKIQNLRDTTAKLLVDNLRTKYLPGKVGRRQDPRCVRFAVQRSSGQNTGAVPFETARTDDRDESRISRQHSASSRARTTSRRKVRTTTSALPVLLFRPEQPVSPSRVMTVMAALFLSTLFGMGLALFLEYLTTRFALRRDRNVSSASGVGRDPDDRFDPEASTASRRSLERGSEDAPNSELLISADSRSALAEAYRQLRTSILLSTGGTRSEIAIDHIKPSVRRERRRPRRIPRSVSLKPVQRF